MSYKLHHIKGFIWKKLGRCYFCGHTKLAHLSQHIRECKILKCDCFGFDVGPDTWRYR